MQIDELNNLTSLFDVYGKLLSGKQYELLSEFLNFNLSETELAESLGVTRQSVHDAISKAKKQLFDFEQKCGILKNNQKTKRKLEILKTNAKTLEEKQAIDDIIDNI